MPWLKLTATLQNFYLSLIAFNFSHFPWFFQQTFHLISQVFFSLPSNLNQWFHLNVKPQVKRFVTLFRTFHLTRKSPPQAFALRAMRNGSYISYYYNFYCYFSIFPQLVFSFFFYFPLCSTATISHQPWGKQRWKHANFPVFLLSLASLCCQKIKILQFPWEAKFYVFFPFLERTYFFTVFHFVILWRDVWLVMANECFRFSFSWEMVGLTSLEWEKKKPAGRMKRWRHLLRWDSEQDVKK